MSSLVLVALPLAPVGAMTPLDAAGPVAMGVGILMIGVLLFGIGRRIARRRRR
ncbi:MAG: hypothetical protein LBE25_06095 [Arthrobacter sp.]|jgi:hypothetical protein|nr:hypothetical protein [Arthrobacter sp.]